MGQNREFGGGAKDKEEILKAILINSVGQSLRAPPTVQTALEIERDIAVSAAEHLTS
jgi:hypothetical protein